MVHPGAELTEPARIEIEIWSRNTAQYNKVALNRSLERWDREIATARPPIVAHDAGWQFPAITEQHAYARMAARLDGATGDHDTVYLGFPFAMLIDLTTHVGAENTRTLELRAALEALRPQLRRYRRVVTVAQHIRAREFPAVFAESGVTDLFWSHAMRGEDHFPRYPGMRLHPFPLYPVQADPRGTADFARARPLLFSFVGTRGAASYLTRSRIQIIDLLGTDPRGKIIDRDKWHYDRIVDQHQVLNRTQLAPGLINEDHSEDFRRIMDLSTFSLCPSGSGPNSIRLWEAMVNGSIPVILAESWQPPGDEDLWQRAEVFCAETAEAIAALPDHLAAIAADPARLRAMSAALHELAGRYGPEGFVGDVVEVMAASLQEIDN
jgi:hypothetical protein